MVAREMISELDKRPTRELTRGWSMRSFRSSGSVASTQGSKKRLLRRNSLSSNCSKPSIKETTNLSFTDLFPKQQRRNSGSSLTVSDKPSIEEAMNLSFTDLFSKQQRHNSGSNLTVSDHNSNSSFTNLFSRQLHRNSCNNRTVSDDFNSSCSSMISDCTEEEESSGCLKVKTQRESLRRANREQSSALMAESSPATQVSEHRVTFGSVTAHYYSYALAGAIDIPADSRFGEPPFLKLGEWFETLEYESVDIYIEESPGNCSSRWGGKFSHKNSSKMQPLRIYARERTLQKAGYSIQEIRESVVTFNTVRHLTPKHHSIVYHRPSIKSI